VEKRLSTAPGDFFEADFGKGHRLATIEHILHSEGRERSQRLLKKVFAALAPGGTVAIQEFVPNEDRTGPPSALPVWRGEGIFYRTVQYFFKRSKVSYPCRSGSRWRCRY
jgi:hypothetical protein